MSTEQTHIEIYCPQCGVAAEYTRGNDPSIPTDLKTIVSDCPDCASTEYPAERWFDHAGNEIEHDQPIKIMADAAE